MAKKTASTFQNPNSRKKTLKKYRREQKITPAKNKKLG